MGETLKGELIPRYSYTVRFHHVDGSPSESYQYHELQGACHHFELYDNDDSGIYSSIELIEHDLLENKNSLLSISFFVDEEEGDDTDEDNPDTPCYGDCNHCSVSEHCDDYTADDVTDDEVDPSECEGCEYVKYWLEHHHTTDHPSTK